MKDLGSCGGHHISNAMMHATEAFDKDAKEALVKAFLLFPSRNYVLLVSVLYSSA